MAAPVVHWEIGGPDLEALEVFYRKLFGWDPFGFDADYRVVEPAHGGETGTETGMGGGLMRCREGMPPYVTIYVSVDDLQATLDEVERLGGKAVVPPTPIPNVGAFAMFSDPAGNVLGLLRPAR